MIPQKTPPMLCIVILHDMRIRSAHYTYDDAKEQAQRTHLTTPCEIMLLVRDDQQRVIGVQELTREEKRECGSWRPQPKMRPEDVVPHRHRLDPVKPRSSVAEDTGAVEMDRAVRD